MSICGGCSCSNIEITWQVIDYSLVPRACQCDYCASRSAAYVSKSGTRFEAVIRDSQYHRTIRHGSNSAVFHECTNCNQVLFVTAEIDGALYGALNANHLVNKFGFADPVRVNFSSHTAAQKRRRWHQNWCYPVVIVE